jgi:hypothetical protein
LSGVILKTFTIMAVAFFWLTSHVSGLDGLQKCGCAQTKSAKFREAALSGLDDLLEKAERSRDIYGFKADDHLGQADLGEPIPIYTVNGEEAGNYLQGQEIEPLLQESGHWLVPVRVDGSFRAFIEVYKTRTNTFVAKTGSLTAARVWKKIIKRWPPEKNFHPKLVIRSDVPGYFFTIPEIDPQNMTDIVQITSEVDKPAMLSPALVILHSWR